MLIPNHNFSMIEVQTIFMFLRTIYFAWKSKNIIRNLGLHHNVIFWGHWYPCFGLLLDFWWYLLWVSMPEWAALFTLGRGVPITHFLRFAFGATPADLLAASIAAEPSLPHTCETLETGSYHAIAHSVRSGRRSTDWAIPARLLWYLSTDWACYS